MFVPSTPGGELMKAMKETDSDFRKGTKIKPIKFVESAGISMADMFFYPRLFRPIMFIFGFYSPKKGADINKFKRLNK